MTRRSEEAPRGIKLIKKQKIHEGKKEKNNKKQTKQMTRQAQPPKSTKNKVKHNKKDNKKSTLTKQPQKKKIIHTPTNK